MKYIHNSDRILEQLIEVAGTLNAAVDAHLTAQGLTPTRAEIVWRIGQRGPLTQRQLSEALGCSPRNVTGLVDALERSGLVARTPHPSDRRAILVTLTERGAAAQREWSAGYRRLAAHLLTGMDAAEVDTLSHALDHLLERLRDPGLAQATWSEPAGASKPRVEPAPSQRDPTD